MPIKFIAMPTEEARASQAGALDANGQAPERHISDGDGVPCRHCQRDVAAGEPYLILAYRPFPEPQPYAEVGPIFLHEEPCERYPSTDATPRMFMKPGRRYLLKGYHLLRHRPDRRTGRCGKRRCGDSGAAGRRLCPRPFGAQQLLPVPDRPRLVLRLRSTCSCLAS